MPTVRLFLLLACRLAQAAGVTLLEFPETQIYAGDKTPRHLQVILERSDVRIVPGPRLRISNRLKIQGIGRQDTLENEARRIVVRFDPTRGELRIWAPRPRHGTIKANVLVELPGPTTIEIRATHARVLLSQVTVNSLDVNLRGGRLELDRLTNKGNSRIETHHASVDVHGDPGKLGHIIPIVHGSGRVKVAKSFQPPSLRITATDGDISIR